MDKNKTFKMLVCIVIAQTIIIIWLSCISPYYQYTTDKAIRASIVPPQKLPVNLDLVLDIDDKKPKDLQIVEF